MKIAHIGPPLARTGGPAGYLLQLQAALANRPSGHEVTFPAPALPAAAPEPGRVPVLRRVARRLRRALTGAPKFYRPDAASLGRASSELDATIRAAVDEMTADAAPNLDRALTGRADVLFTHDLGGASAALERRQPGQAVWLMLHSPMPIALYLAWNWGVPEQDWREVMMYPDVRAWTDRELHICSRVDRIVLPCREAAEELARCDRRFESLLASADIVMTGASANRDSGSGTPHSDAGISRAALRARWRLPLDQRVGLFLGSAQAYRGFDMLLDGLARLGDTTAVPGAIAVAGPDPTTIPVADRVRALGRVEDVGALLRAVDFVININRFSLFDLSVIEALEAGKPMLLHDTGGNRAFRSLGAGCVSIPNLDAATIAGGLERLFSMLPSELDDLARRSRGCYELHLTLDHFARRHLHLYDGAAPRGRPGGIAAKVTA